MPPCPGEETLQLRPELSILPASIGQSRDLDNISGVLGASKLRSRLSVTPADRRVLRSELDGGTYQARLRPEPMDRNEDDTERDVTQSAEPEEEELEGVTTTLPQTAPWPSIRRRTTLAAGEH